MITITFTQKEYDLLIQAIHILNEATKPQPKAIGANTNGDIDYGDIACE